MLNVIGGDTMSLIKTFIKTLFLALVSGKNGMEGDENAERVGGHQRVRNTSSKRMQCKAEWYLTKFDTISEIIIQ